MPVLVNDMRIAPSHGKRNSGEIGFNYRLSSFSPEGKEDLRGSLKKGEPSHFTKDVIHAHPRYCRP